MLSRSLTIEQVLTLLAEAPPRIAALTADLAPAQLHTPPNPGESTVCIRLAEPGVFFDAFGPMQE